MSQRVTQGAALPFELPALPLRFFSFSPFLRSVNEPFEIHRGSIAH